MLRKSKCASAASHSPLASSQKNTLIVSKTFLFFSLFAKPHNYMLKTNVKTLAKHLLDLYLQLLFPSTYSKQNINHWKVTLALN